MKQLPIFLNLKGRHCLVIGSDHAAWCKTELLLSAGAHVHVNADSLNPKMKEHLSGGSLSFSEKKITDIENSTFSLVFIADCDAERASALSAQCQHLGIPVNAVDQPALCSFTVPSIIDRNPITIAIGSAGSSPILARRIRSQIESIVPRAFGPLAKLMGKYRALVAKKIPFSERRAFWDSALDGPVTQQVLDGNMLAAETALLDSINNQRKNNPSQQKLVTIIDARHNNCELMTLQSVQALHRAEHIVHAPSLHREILRLARRDAHRHALQRLDQDFQVSPSKITDRLEALTAGGHHVALLVSNANWSDQLFATLRDRLQAKQITTSIPASVECRDRPLREVS